MSKKSRESDQENGNQIDDLILTTGIGSRINEAAKRVGGKRKLAEMIGLSEAQLYRITGGTNQPKTETIAAIARACGVSLDWLVIGRGPVEGSATAERQLEPVERQRLVDVVETVEEVLQARGMRLQPDKFAQLIVLVYEEIAEAEEAGVEWDREKVVRLVSLAS